MAGPSGPVLRSGGGGGLRGDTSPQAGARTFGARSGLCTAPNPPAHTPSAWLWAELFFQDQRRGDRAIFPGRFGEAAVYTIARITHVPHPHLHQVIGHLAPVVWTPPASCPLCAQVTAAPWGLLCPPWAPCTVCCGSEGGWEPGLYRVSPPPRPAKPAMTGLGLAVSPRMTSSLTPEPAL